MSEEAPARSAKHVRIFVSIFPPRPVREVVEEEGQDLFTNKQYSMVWNSAREVSQGDPGRIRYQPLHISDVTSRPALRSGPYHGRTRVGRLAA